MKTIEVSVLFYAEVPDDTPANIDTKLTKINLESMELVTDVGTFKPFAYETGKTIMSFIGRQIKQVKGCRRDIGRIGTVIEQVTNDNGVVYLKTEEDGIWCLASYAEVIS